MATQETKPEIISSEGDAPHATIETKKKSGWFQKIPTKIMLSPGGMVLLVFAFFMEIIDLIPIPFVDQLWELPLELIFVLLLWVIAKTPLKAALIPILLERIPLFSDIFPTWVVRLLT